MEKEVVYLPHPVSAEEKAEYVSAGYKILDIAYKPVDAVEAKPKGKAKTAPKDEAEVI